MTAQEFKAKYIPLKAVLYRMAFSLLKQSQDAEDAVQETYIKLWRMKDSLDSIRNSEAYSVTLVRNISLDLLRTQQRKGYPLSVDEVEIEDKQSTIDQQLEHRSHLHLIESWLNTLPHSQREVFVCRHQQGMSIREIAQQLDLSESNVKVILSRLRTQVKEVIVR